MSKQVNSRMKKFRFRVGPDVRTFYAADQRQATGLAIEWADKMGFSGDIKAVRS